jgi:GST-like protein
MIDLYAWKTPNAHKVFIMLEECQLPYQLHPINITAGAQFSPEYLQINPNNKIPAIIDPEGDNGKPLKLFESGAILYYLARKTGKFLPTELAQQSITLEWLFWQMAGFGPMLGQMHHFNMFAPQKIPYAITRYAKETQRLYKVLDQRLSEAKFLDGNDYSIADIATFPWTRYHQWENIQLTDYPHVQRWASLINERPAVKKALSLDSTY